MQSDLIIRLPNWVGDVCMALPALQALEKSGAKLRLVGRGWAKDLLAGTGWPVETVPRGIFAASRLYAQLPVKNVLLFPGSFSSALGARLAGKKVLGQAGDGRWILLWKSLPPGTGHEIERSWHLAQQAAQRLRLNVSSFHGSIPDPHLPLSPEHDQIAETLLPKVPYIVLAPLATGTIKGCSKTWPHFSALAAHLAPNHHLLACPGPGEEDAMRRVLPQAQILSGVKLGTYAALMRRASLVIANDSGPLHLAAAVGAKAIGLYGVSDPARYGARGIVHLGNAQAWPSLESVKEHTRNLR